MKITVILHSILREILPVEKKGQTDLDLPAESRVEDVIGLLGLPGFAVCSVNGEMEPDRTRRLQDGDVLRFFRPSAGG